MKLLALLMIGLISAILTYIRKAPVPQQPKIWDPLPDAPGDYAKQGGFLAVRNMPDDTAPLLDIIRNSPLTEEREAGDGPANFVTRTLYLRFPDVTQVWVENGLLYVSGHLVMGRKDFGVNRARILGWLSDADI